MSVFTNDRQNPIKVQFRKVGKVYGAGSPEENAFDNEKETSYPFEEVLVAVGESVDVGEITWSDIVEITPFSEATQKSLDQIGREGTA